MSEQSLNDFYDGLIEVLIHQIVFYIPEEIAPKDVVENVNKINGENIFNKLLVMDFKGGWLTYEQEKFRPLLLEKHTNLEKNLFKLLQKKSEIEPFKFKYILDKYIEQAEFYHFITCWLNNHLTIYNKSTVDENIIGDFQLQYSYYKKHMADLIKHLYPSNDYVFRKEFEILELLEYYFPDLITRTGKENENSANTSEIDIPVSEIGKPIVKQTDFKGKEKTAKKIKKEPLVTDKEVEDFLLTTVFNIKLDETIEKDINKI